MSPARADISSKAQSHDHVIFHKFEDRKQAHLQDWIYLINIDFFKVIVSFSENVYLKTNYSCTTVESLYLYSRWNLTCCCSFWQSMFLSSQCSHNYVYVVVCLPSSSSPFLLRGSHHNLRETSSRFCASPQKKRGLQLQAALLIYPGPAHRSPWPSLCNVFCSISVLFSNSVHCQWSSAVEGGGRTRTHTVLLTIRSGVSQTEIKIKYCQRH